MYYFTRWITKSYPILHYLVVQTPEGLKCVWVSNHTGNLDTSDTISKFKSPVNVYINLKTGCLSEAHHSLSVRNFRNFFRGDFYTREICAKKVWRF